MKFRFAISAGCIALLTLALPGHAQMSPEAIPIVQRPIEVTRSQDVETVPLIPHMGKFAVQASANGVERSFVFDTGSPTLISQELADQLGVTVVGSNTGRDANGQPFTTKIGLLDQLTIGGLAFTNVPVLIADFRVADPDGCFFDGGVIGSNIFPGSVWHFDGARNLLQIARDAGDLPALHEGARAHVSRLYADAYPYAPVFDYALGEMKDRALFDTGSSDTVVLFDRLLGNSQVEQSIVRGSKSKGRGSHGVSAAGIGEIDDLLRFDLDGLTVGDALPRLPGTTRNAPPSLVGLGILDRYDVTLDYPGGRMLLQERDTPAPSTDFPGYALMMRDGAAEVVQLFDGSAAKKAGLRLGDRVVAIDGRSLAMQEGACAASRWLAQDRPTHRAQVLTVLRDGAPVELSLRPR